MEKATFGAGCFWNVEEVFRKVEGVKETAVGFSGGRPKNPSYKQVCTAATGHAEVVQVKFDPKVVSYSKLLDIFWKVHNPTQLDRQGVDIGEQYRSVIFYHSPAQMKAAEASKKKWQTKYNNRIVTEIVKAKPFYKAEEAHQKYIQKKSESVLGGFLSKMLQRK